MTSKTTGRLAAVLAVGLKPLAGLALVLLLPALSACTTAEGTNALVDPATFEREVMISTAQGLDLVPQDVKKPDNQRRAPLVLPKQMAQLPAPTTSTASAAVPTDSDNPQINTAGLTDADIQHLRNARVMDLRSLDGRPLTDLERKQLTARMAAANVAANDGSRPLTLPPVSYFSDYKGKDTVCKSADGTLVALTDPKCPQQVRDAMRKPMATPMGVSQSIEQDTYNMQHGITPDGN